MHNLFIWILIIKVFLDLDKLQGYLRTKIKLEGCMLVCEKIFSLRGKDYIILKCEYAMNYKQPPPLFLYVIADNFREKNA